MHLVGLVLGLEFEKKERSNEDQIHSKLFDGNPGHHFSSHKCHAHAQLLTMARTYL